MKITSLLQKEWICKIKEILLVSHQILNNTLGIPKQRKIKGI